MKGCRALDEEISRARVVALRKNGSGINKRLDALEVAGVDLRAISPQRQKVTKCLLTLGDLDLASEETSKILDEFARIIGSVRKFCEEMEK